MSDLDWNLGSAEKKERSIGLWKILLGLFFITYFLWYINGGPEKWDKKIGGEINKKNIGNNIINTMFID